MQKKLSFLMQICLHDEEKLQTECVYNDGSIGDQPSYGRRARVAYAECCGSSHRVPCLRGGVHLTFVDSGIYRYVVGTKCMSHSEPAGVLVSPPETLFGIIPPLRWASLGAAGCSSSRRPSKACHQPRLQGAEGHTNKGYTPAKR